MGNQHPGLHVPSPATPAPAFAPASQAMPWDTNYQTTVGQVNRNRDQTLAAITAQEGQVKQDYGFDDASSPFSRIAMLKQAFMNHQRGNTNGLAAQGQLYSGALVNAQNENQHELGTGGVQYDALRRNYSDLLHGLAQRRVQAQNNATDSLGAADYNRTLTALQNRPDPSTLPPPAVPTPAPRAPRPHRPHRPRRRH